MSSRRLTVQEAAEVLGTSVDAVRMRARRGSLESEKEPDGRVYVWVDGDSSETKHRLNGESDALRFAQDELVEELRGQLEHMRRESERKDAIIMQMAQANAALASRVPALEPPSGRPEGWLEDQEYEREDAGLSTRPDHVRQQWYEKRYGAPGARRDGPESASEVSTPGEPRLAPEGAQEGSERRSWWRRVFGMAG